MNKDGNTQSPHPHVVAEDLLRRVLQLLQTRGDLQRFYDKITGLEAWDTSPPPAENVMGSDALRLVIEYDTLLRKYQGDEDVILFDGDIVEVDDAYDRMVEAARSSLAKPSEPSKEQIERAIEAYREGGYLNDEQVYASVTAIVRAALSAEVEG